jgi:predicted RNase H-like nuclease (RuvC/YqgF family)
LIIKQQADTIEELLSSDPQQELPFAGMTFQKSRNRRNEDFEEYETQIDEIKCEAVALKAENSELKQQLEECRSGLVSHEHLQMVVSKL